MSLVLFYLCQERISECDKSFPSTVNLDIINSMACISSFYFTRLILNQRLIKLLSVSRMTCSKINAFFYLNDVEKCDK